MARLLGQRSLDVGFALLGARRTYCGIDVAAGFPVATVLVLLLFAE
jgi:hypothetical protein